MNRTDVALEGAPPGATLRLELAWRETPSGLRLEFLHDEARTGTFARVVRGRLVQGDLSLPVAVKLQRDLALSREAADGVAAKFLLERAIHRRLQEGADAAELDRRPVVRQLDVFPAPDEDLPPCVVCARAPHALAPRCPSCGKAVLESTDQIRTDDSRLLACPNCGKQFADAAADAVLRATVQKDSACRDCPHRIDDKPDICLRNAAVLNFFPGKVLLLELLDLDLDQYLRWQRGQVRRDASPRAAELFHSEQKRLDQQEQDCPRPLVPYLRLAWVCDVFAAVVAAVRLLHERGIYHLDLKLENVCIRFEATGPRVKLIDLGLGDDERAANYLRQANAKRSVDSPFAAVEMRQSVDANTTTVNIWLEEERCEIDPQPLEPDLPCPGDSLLLPGKSGGEVRYGVWGRIETNERSRVWAMRYDLYEKARQSGSGFPPLTEAARQGKVPVRLRRRCAAAADIFSLGMILWALVTREPEVVPNRDQLLGNLQIALERQPAEVAKLPARALVDRLVENPSDFLRPFCDAAARLAKNSGPAAPLAWELLGLALRAAVRSAHPLSLLAHRGDDARTGAALERLTEEVDAVRRAAERTLAAGRGEAQQHEVRERRRRTLRLLADSVGTAAVAGPPATAVPFPLDLAALNESLRQREADYLAFRLPDPSARRRFLFDLQLQLTVSAAERERRLIVLLSHASSAAPTLGDVYAFLETWERVRKAGGPAPEEAAWVEQHADLNATLLASRDALRGLADGLQRLRERVFAPWSEAIVKRIMGVFPRQQAEVKLSPEFGQELDRLLSPASVGPQLEKWNRSVERVAWKRKQRLADAVAFWKALRERNLFLTRLPLGPILEQEWAAALTAEYDHWQQGFLDDAAKMATYLDGLEKIVLVLSRSARDGPAALMLDREQGEKIDPERATVAVLVDRWLRDWPGPPVLRACQQALKEFTLLPIQRASL